MKNVCNNFDYCYVEMPKEDNKILKYNSGENSILVLFIIYADLESLLEKMNTCHNNHKKLSTIRQRIRYHLIQQKINSIIIEVKIV